MTTLNTMNSLNLNLMAARNATGSCPTWLAVVLIGSVVALAVAAVVVIAKTWLK